MVRVRAREGRPERELVEVDVRGYAAEGRGDRVDEAVRVGAPVLQTCGCSHEVEVAETCIVRWAQLACEEPAPEYQKQKEVVRTIEGSDHQWLFLREFGVARAQELLLIVGHVRGARGLIGGGVTDTPDDIIEGLDGIGDVGKASGV